MDSEFSSNKYSENFKYSRKDLLKITLLLCNSSNFYLMQLLQNSAIPILLVYKAKTGKDFNKRAVNVL